jgi:TatD DNase family protein
MDLIDIGINLTHEAYRDDLGDVLARASAAGVRQMVVTGASVAGSEHALTLVHAHAGRLWCTAGVHPHHASELHEPTLGTLRQLLANPAVVAAGECGLDYYRNFSPYADQRRAFDWQLQLALDSGKPAFLHQRDAHRDFLAALVAHPGVHGVAHCFTGGQEELEAYLGLGLHIGITGWVCDERRGAHLQPLVARIPRGRLLLETDGPYLLPRDLDPKPPHRRNEPAYLPHICRVVARLRGESPEDCAAHTSAAARALFGLAPPDRQPTGVQPRG